MVIYCILCLFLDIPLIWDINRYTLHTMFHFGYSLNMGISTFTHGLNMTMSLHFTRLWYFILLPIYINTTRGTNILPIYDHIITRYVV